MFATTPKLISKDVLKLRDKIGLSTEPVFVPVRDTAGHEINDCYFNVARKIKAEGGTSQHGWTVWEAEGKFIEGEFHAIWVSPIGEFVDITPHADGETQILFIPDPDRIYSREPVDNVRLALCNDPSIRLMIEAGERMAVLRTKYNNGSGKAEVPIRALSNVMESGGSMGKPGRNDGCPCGSGKKFKRCHGAHN